jgi:hypothetical protein
VAAGIADAAALGLDFAHPSRHRLTGLGAPRRRLNDMHLAAIVLVCLIFVALGFIGSGIVDRLGGDYTATRRWLLTPIAGLSLLTLLATVLNRIGFPAKNFGLPLIGALIVANVAYWWIRRPPRIDRRRAALWGAGLFTTLLLVGWPLIVGGFDWVSYGNVDMTTYLLGANHFYEHGYYQLPPLQELLREVDPSWDYSFYYSLGEVRSASQLVLALAMAVTWSPAVKSYMALILALHLVVLATAAAFMCSNRTREKLAFASLLIIGSSANLAVGTFNQLLPQDFGIAALAASAIVLLDRPPAGSAFYRRAVLGGLFVATLLVAYPEMLPFLMAPFAIYAALSLFKRKIELRHWLAFTGLIAAWVFVFANASLPGALHLLIWAFGASTSFTDVGALFPYYMTPFGLALGWGLAPMQISDAGASSWQTQARIAVGGLVFLIAIFLTIRDALRLEPLAIVAAMMLILFIDLFFTKNAFGLFKLAMYAQPFVLGALTISIARMFGESVETKRAVLES